MKDGFNGYGGWKWVVDVLVREIGTKVGMEDANVAMREMSVVT